MKKGCWQFGPRAKAKVFDIDTPFQGFLHPIFSGVHYTRRVMAILQCARLTPGANFAGLNRLLGCESLSFDFDHRREL
jgi:hypothetical protein